MEATLFSAVPPAQRTLSFDKPTAQGYPAHPFFVEPLTNKFSDMPTTEVILTEKIYNLGAEADIA